jgi:competence ComEA-like helix-hairpin-helix protein
MTQHLSNLARHAAHGAKQRLAQIAQLPHQVRAQVAHQLKYNLPQHLFNIAAIVALLFSMGGTWTLASDANAAPNHPTAVAATSTTAATPDDASPASSRFATKKDVAGKLNLNTATEQQLMLLPTIGPSKAERVVTWRKKNGGFKRPADLRRVKGFGYKTFKRLEPFLDIKGDTTLSAKR